MKEYLKKILAAKQKRAADLRDLITNATTADEVRSYGNELTEVENEEREAQEQLNALAAAEQNAGAGSPQQRFNPLATYGMRYGRQRNNEPDAETDPLNTVEYRSAFMQNVLKGTPIPDNLRANANTLTSDVTSVLPTVLVNQIIERMDQCGMILPLVTRTSHPAGVVIPTSSVKPVATWVAEGKSSDKQKKTTGKITFSYFKLRCEISLSMEVGTIALSAFEAKFVENVSKAMIIAIEKSIIAGNGTSQPKGILKETAAGTLELAKAEPTYKELVEAEGLVPAEFEANAKWCMTKAQFMKFVGMTDTAGQPIARINYGLAGKIERTLLGREVVIHPYATEMGSVAAFIFDFSDYVLNTIYDMGIQKKQDWDTEDLLTKAVMSVDGKAVDAGSLITLTVKTAA